MILFINNAIPILGVVIAIFAICSKRVCTIDSSNAAFIHLSVMLWLILIAADWTGNHTAVWQTVTARGIALVQLIIMIKIEYKALSRYRPRLK